MGRFFTNARDVTIELYSLRSADIVAQVLDSQIDFGLCFSPQQHPRLHIQQLSLGKIKLYVRPRHPLLKQKVPLKYLSDYPALLPKALAGIEICETHPVFKKHGITPDSRITFDNYGVATAILQHTDAWGFFADFVEYGSSFPVEELPLPQSWDASYLICGIRNRERAVDADLEHLMRQIMFSESLSWKKR